MNVDLGSSRIAEHSLKVKQEKRGKETKMNESHKYEERDMGAGKR